MKKILGLLILLLALTACATTPEQQQDLYAEAQFSKATADAAQAKSQLQAGFLTATQQAPIIHITETAAALVVVQTQVAFASTQTAAAWTPTPSPTPTPNLTATMAVSLLQAQQTQMVNNTLRDNLQLERERSANSFWGILPALTFFIVAFLLLLAAWVAVRISRYRPVTVDARGNPVPVMDVVNGKVTDIDKSPNYQGDLSAPSIGQTAIQLARKILALPAPMPLLTAERQDATTERAQMVALATRGNGRPAARQVAGNQMGRLTANNRRAPVIEIVPPDNVSGWLEDVQGQLADHIEEDA
jgi:hypothetical protein